MGGAKQKLSKMFKITLQKCASIDALCRVWLAHAALVEGKPISCHDFTRVNCSKRSLGRNHGVSMVK